jgi:hypothetical protein
MVVYVLFGVHSIDCLELIRQASLAGKLDSSFCCVRVLETCTMKGGLRIVIDV